MTQFPPPPGVLDSDSPRPSSFPFRELLAWLVIIASVATIMTVTAKRYQQMAAAPTTQTSELRVMQLTVLAKSGIGARELLASSSSGGGQNLQQIQQIEKQLDDLAVSPTEKVRVAIAQAELHDAKAAIERLNAIEPTVTTDEARQDIAALRAIYTSGPATLPSDQQQRLIERYGWFGRLALGSGQGSDNPNRHIALKAGKRTIIAMSVGGILFLLAFVVGLILLILAIVFVADGQLTRAFRPTGRPAGPYIEAFAIYLGGYLAISLFARFVAPKLIAHPALYYVAMLLPPLAAVLWPLRCGVPRDQWKQALGWHGGRGAGREMLLGMCGYLAGLPFVAGMFWVAVKLSAKAAAQPTHPVVRQLGGSAGELVEVFILACVFAPIVEETMFRGTFFNYMRSSFGWFISAIVTSFIFAAIHPQGWTMIPALMSIAIVLAAIREWRGTILASAAAHALNNGAVLLFAVMVLR